MKFENIITNEASKLTAQSILKEDHIPHAMLLTGPSGTGKLALAMAIASYIVCENKTDGEPCGECKACRKSFQLLHPDVHFSFPFTGANNTSDEFIATFREAVLKNSYINLKDWLQALEAENKQANINTKECRAIIQKLGLKSYESESKVLVMWLPEFLRKEGNRLLKLIEEPTDNTFIILVSDKPDQILPTIISRCQIIKVKQISDEHLIEALESNMNIEAEEAKQITFLAEGDINKAIQLINHDAKGMHTEVLDWFRICYSMKAIELVPWVEDFGKKNKEEVRQFLQYAISFLRQVVRVPTMDKKHIRLNENEYETAKKMSGIITFDKIETLSRVLSENFYYIERNANVKLMIMDTSLQFTKILRRANAAAS